MLVLRRGVPILLLDTVFEQDINAIVYCLIFVICLDFILHFITSIVRNVP